MKSFKQGNGRGESYLERWINNNGGGDDLMLFDVSGHRIEWPLINRQVMEFIGCCIQGGGGGGSPRGGSGGYMGSQDAGDPTLLH